MERYKTAGSGSGISHYEIGSDHIKIKFNTGNKTYIYSYRSAGKKHIDEMKILAQRGNGGLNTYINKYVKDLYER
jgi:hypothetical protein